MGHPVEMSPVTRRGVTAPADEEAIVIELTTDECWAFLAHHEFGRLAYVLDGGADVVPINYAVDEGRIVFRTAMGSKFSGVMSDATCALEVDLIEGEEATSVVVRGLAVELPDDGAHAARAEQAGLRPWLDSVKPHLVAIDVTHITGRRHALHRPWTSMLRAAAR